MHKQHLYRWASASATAAKNKIGERQIKSQRSEPRTHAQEPPVVGSESHREVVVVRSNLRSKISSANADICFLKGRRC